MWNMLRTEPTAILERSCPWQGQGFRNIETKCAQIKWSGQGMPVHGPCRWIPQDERFQACRALIVEKKTAATVLVRNEQNAGVGLGTRVLFRASIRKIQPRDSSHHFRLLVFRVYVRFSPAITFPAKKKRDFGIEQYFLWTFFFTANYWIREQDY